MVQKIIIIATLLFMIGCTSTRINNQLASRTVSYEKYFKKAKVQPLANRVILIGDNQFNNIYTDPTVLRNIYADTFAEVSIRPPQVDIFSPQLFKWTLQKYNAKDNYIIHLGDALNIACLNEWDIFKDVLNGVDSKKFVMAVGNHDIYWYGVTNGEYNSDKEKWASSCADGYRELNGIIDDSKRFTKGKFINKYLNFIPVNYAKDTTGYFYNKNRNAFVEEVYVKRFTTQKDEYSSFLVQKINIPAKNGKLGLKGIIIDTVTYTEKPLNVKGHFEIGGHYNSGEAGEVTQPQKDIINRWSREFRKQKKPFMIFGHHPLKEFIDIERIWIDKLIKNNPYALGYISAHTHLGYVDDNNNTLLEINVGSITDYPNEIRTLEVSPTQKLLKSTMHPIAQSKLDNTPWCDALYDYTSVYPDNYLSYQFAGDGIYTIYDTQEATLNISISTYLRLFEDLQVIQYFYNDDNMIEEYATLTSKAKAQRDIDCSKNGTSCRGEKLRVVKDLEMFSKKIEVKSPDIYVPNLILYGSCQALKASKAEWIGNYSNAK
jgi:hypothetical protein